MATETNIEQQPPLCDHYPEGEVIAAWPSGKVQKFPSLAKAKTLLMRHHYQYIMCTPEELLDVVDEDLSKRWGINEDEWLERTPDWLWRYALDIAVERNPWMKAGEIPESNKLSKRVTASGYKINTAKAKTWESMKLPKQAKVIAMSLLEFEDDAAVSDEDIEKLLRKQLLNGVLNTKQDVMRIFAYYRPALLEAGIIALRS